MKNIFLETGRILAYREPLDFRWGWSRIIGTVLTVLEQMPTSGDIFVFTNRSRKLLCFLFWDRTGFIHVKKRLENGCFHLVGRHKLHLLTEEQFRLLLDGIAVSGKSLKK